MGARMDLRNPGGVRWRTKKKRLCRVRTRQPTPEEIYSLGRNDIPRAAFFLFRGYRGGTKEGCSEVGRFAVVVLPAVLFVVVFVSQTFLLLASPNGAKAHTICLEARKK